jgi:hypothetical protein
MGGGGGLLGGVTNALFGSPSQPATPDYTGAAQQTAQGNLDAARQATAANRVNQITPYGSLRYAETGTDQYGNPTWTATSSLSPDMQELYNYDIASSKGLGQLQSKGLNYVGQMIDQPFSTSGLPQLSSQLNAPNLGQVGQGPQFNQLGQAEAMRRIGESQQAQGVSPAEAMLRAGSTEQLQRDLENQGMAGWDKATGLLMQRLEPQLERQQRSLDAQLANQGISRGSRAYSQAQQDLGQRQNDLLNQAALSGQQVQQNLFGQALSAGQFGNQAATQQQQNQLANLGFSNTAAQQDYANRMSGQQLQNQAAQQNYSNLLAGAQFGNTAAQQDYANQQAQLAMNNALMQQGYGNQLTANQQNNAAMQQMFANQTQQAQLANQARGQGFQELAYQRNEPINTLNAVRSGSQVTTPNQFYVNAPQQATTAGADYLGAAGMTGNAAIAGANAENANRNAMMQGLFSLGGAAMMSDIRTKENIKHIGFMANGLNVYEFEYKPEFKDIAGEGKFVGVMAQEVELVQPEAVITRPDGYKMVDYGVLQ